MRTMSRFASAAATCSTSWRNELSRGCALTPSPLDGPGDFPAHRFVHGKVQVANDTVKSKDPKKAVVAFAVVALAWLVFDRVTKSYFEGAYDLGQAGTNCGLFRFTLVHNTGAAWGMFGDSTFMLGITSLIVCALIVLCFAFWEKLAGHAPSALETFSLALVFSGGLGNAFDRFAQSYVIDFIDFTFIDFPVFNIADIGVTCGFVLLVLGYLLATRKGDAHV